MKEVKQFQCDFCSTILPEEYMIQHEQFCMENPNAPVCHTCGLYQTTGHPFELFCKHFPELIPYPRFQFWRCKACPKWEPKILKVMEI